MVCPTTKNIVKVHSKEAKAVPFKCPHCGKQHTAIAVTPGADGGAQSGSDIVAQLNPKIRALVDQSRQQGETALFFLSSGSQALVAFENRCIIAKAGFMSGSAFGGKTTSFNYSDITGIEIQTGMTTGFLEILTSSFQANADKGFWTSDRNNDPFKLPNCLPFGNKKALEVWRPNIDHLRQLIAEHRRGGFGAAPITVPPSAPPTLDPLDQIKKLADLRDAGILTEEEFQAKKEAAPQPVAPLLDWSTSSRKKATSKNFTSWLAAAVR